MLNLVSAVVMNGVVVLFSIIKAVVAQLVIGIVVGILVLTMASGAHASVGYVDPIVMQFGTNYTSYEVITYYGRDCWKILFMLFIIVVCVAYLWVKGDK